MPFFSALVLGVLSIGPVAAAQEPRPEDLPVEARVLGSFRVCEDGVGFLLLGGSLLFEALVIHNDRVEPTVFVLDAGSLDACRVDVAFMERLGLPPDAAFSLKIGQQEVVADIKPGVQELAELRRFSKEFASVLQGRAVSGIVGFPIFQGRLVQLDFGEFRIKILPPPAPANDEAAAAGGDAVPGSEEPTAAVLKVPYRMDPLPLCCDVVVNQTDPAVFQITTACAASWVKKDVAAKARWRKGKRPASFVIGGQDASEPVVEFAFREWKEGEAEPPVAGVLGNDFLFYYIVTVNTAESCLLLEPLKPPPPPPPIAQPSQPEAPESE